MSDPVAGFKPPEPKGLPSTGATTEVPNVAPPPESEKLTEEDLDSISTLEDVPPQKVFFVYDRDTILEAEVIKGEIPNPLDLQVTNLIPHKFTTNISTPPSNKEFKSVRKGTGRTDVGTYFIE